MKSGNDLIELASELAHAAHRGQFRRDGITPYIVHAKEVAAAVQGDAKTEAIAWLHDVIEHTSTNAERLRLEGISEGVIEVVLLLTHREEVDYEDYIVSIKSSAIASKIKIADIISNLSDHPSAQEMVKYARALLALLS